MTTEYDDAEIGNISATYGVEFGGGRGHFMIHGDYTDRAEVRYPDRDFAAYWNRDVYDENGQPTGFENWYSQLSVNSAIADPFYKLVRSSLTPMGNFNLIEKLMDL